MNLTNLDDFAIPRELMEWLLANIKPGNKVLEFGSGSGTIELCKHYEVWSIEHAEEWVGHCP